MRAILTMIATVFGAVPLSAHAKDEPAPDLAFLEYLGSWEASDDEWVLAAEVGEEELEEADRARRRDPPATRKDDE